MKAKEQGIFLAALDELEKDKGLKKRRITFSCRNSLISSI